VKIRLCRHNPGATEFVDALILKQPSANIKLKDCLKRCKKCRHLPFARVGKEFIDADTWGELEDLLMKSV